MKYFILGFLSCYIFSGAYICQMILIATKTEPKILSKLLITINWPYTIYFMLFEFIMIDNKEN